MNALRFRRISFPELYVDFRQSDIDIAWDVFQSLMGCVPCDPPFENLREQLQLLDDAWEDLSDCWPTSNFPPRSSKRYSADFHFSFPEAAQAWTSAHLDDLSEQLQKLHARILKFPEIRPELQRLREAWDSVADELSNLLYDQSAYETERSER